VPEFKFWHGICCLQYFSREGLGGQLIP